MLLERKQTNECKALLISNYVPTYVIRYHGGRRIRMLSARVLHRRRSQYVEGMYSLLLQRSTVPTGQRFTDIPDGMFLHILSHT